MVAFLKRYLVAFVFFSAGFWAIAEPCLAEFKILQKGSSKRVIVFVHGLWGDPLSTFKAVGSPSWPDIVVTDDLVVHDQPALSTYSTATLGFPAGPTGKLLMPEISRQLARELKASALLSGDYELYFVAHSLGGLVVKDMLLNELGAGDSPIVKRTKAVFLISTPSAGSEAAEFISKLPTMITGTLLVDVKTIANNSFLTSLQDRWHDHLRDNKRRRVAVYCAYEKKSVLGRFFDYVVVPRHFADDYCDETPAAMNEDHFSIVKPTSLDATIHQWLRSSLAAIGQKRTAAEAAEVEAAAAAALLARPLIPPLASTPAADVKVVKVPVSNESARSTKSALPTVSTATSGIASGRSVVPNSVAVSSPNDHRLGLQVSIMVRDRIAGITLANTRSEAAVVLEVTGEYGARDDRRGTSGCSQGFQAIRFRASNDKTEAVGEVEGAVCLGPIGDIDSAKRQAMDRATTELARVLTFELKRLRGEK
jgi:pimeloyl-ACP methyl ester carboxylesterase